MSLTELLPAIKMLPRTDKLRLMQFLWLLWFVFLVGCAAELTAQRTQNLRVRMTTTEVKAVLGEPNSVQLVNGDLIWKYLLVESAFNIAPYFLIFSNPEQKLETWFIARTDKESQDMLAAFRARRGSN